MALPAKSPGDFSLTGTYTATNFNDQINPVYTWGQGEVDVHIAATVAHGATGAVVGTTNTQTLSDKTLTTPVIAAIYQDVAKTKLMSLPNTASDTLAAIAATQTISNKTVKAQQLDQQTMGGSATVTAGKHSVMCTAAGITVTLPTTAVALNGYRITVTDTTGTAGASNITVDGEGAETISEVSSVAIVEGFGSMTFEAYNNKWWIV